MCTIVNYHSVYNNYCCTIYDDNKDRVLIYTHNLIVVSDSCTAVVVQCTGNYSALLLQWLWPIVTI